MFRKTMKSMFSNKCINRESTTLIKYEKFFSENLEVDKMFNAFFLNKVKEMNISLVQELLSEVDRIKDPVY